MRPGQSAGIRGGPASSANAFIMPSSSARLIEFARGPAMKGRKFTGHSLAGLSFENANRHITDENEFSQSWNRENVALPNFSRRHRWSRKSPAIAALRAGNAGEQQRKSSRHRAGAIARELLSPFRGGQSCSKINLHSAHPIIPPARVSLNPPALDQSCRSFFSAFPPTVLSSPSRPSISLGPNQSTVVGKEPIVCGAISCGSTQSRVSYLHVDEKKKNRLAEEEQGEEQGEEKNYTEKKRAAATGK